MTDRRWQFSLRGLLMVTTLVAVGTAVAVNFPIVATAYLTFAAMILVGRACAYLVIKAPLLARSLLAFVGTAWLIGVGPVWVHDYMHPSRFDSDLWVGFFMVILFPIFCYWVAWIIPQKPKRVNEAPPAESIVTSL